MTSLEMAGSVGHYCCLDFALYIFILLGWILLCLLFSFTFLNVLEVFKYFLHGLLGESI